MLRAAALAAALAQGAAADLFTARALQPGYAYTDYLRDTGKAHGGAGAEAAFAANLRAIAAHNARNLSWRMAVNRFTDWTKDEFRARRLSRGPRPHFAAAAPAAALRAGDLPASVDWRTKDAVTSVKDQGGCGSCWAFSATESIESAVAVATGSLLDLSPQQIVSCMANPDQCGGTGGCAGAIEELAFNYTKATGLSTASDYPYTSGNGDTGSCKESKIKPAAGVNGYVKLPTNDYTALMNAVATVGPVSVSAAAEAWQMYGAGVFASENCGYVTDHGIQLVGYGEDAGDKYWLVRNSWGAGWGEQGYIRIKRYGEGEEPCGMDNKPQDGSACKGDTDPVRFCGLCALLSDSSYPTGAFLVDPPKPTPAPPPTPSPPATPAPPNPHAACDAALKQHGCVNGDGSDCAFCCISNSDELAKAGCTQDYEEAWCG